METRVLRVRIKPIAVSFKTDGLASKGHIVNLSKKGLFVRSDELPAVKETIRLAFKDLYGGRIEVVGRVRWTTEQLKSDRHRSRGFGVVFTEWNGAYHDFFEQLLMTRSTPVNE